jgi:hypothetical protein
VLDLLKRNQPETAWTLVTAGESIGHPLPEAERRSLVQLFKDDRRRRVAKLIREAQTFKESPNRVLTAADVWREAERAAEMGVSDAERENLRGLVMAAKKKATKHTKPAKPAKKSPEQREAIASARRKVRHHEGEARRAHRRMEALDRRALEQLSHAKLDANCHCRKRAQALSREADDARDEARGHEAHVKHFLAELARLEKA